MIPQADASKWIAKGNRADMIWLKRKVSLDKKKDDEDVDVDDENNDDTDVVDDNYDDIDDDDDNDGNYNDDCDNGDDNDVGDDDG